MNNSMIGSRGIMSNVEPRNSKPTKHPNMKHLLTIAFIALTSPIACGGGFRNPVINADAPDMSVCSDGKHYYMVSTTMHLMPGAPIMRSDDMVHWETISYVFDKLDNGPEYSLSDKNGRTIYGQGQWASSLRYHNGKFYCWFVCNGAPGYIFTADKAEGPWRLLARPCYRHDASLFFDDNGRTYLFHGSGSITELSADLQSVKEGGLEKQLFTRDADEQALLEGSAAFKKDGWYYLMMISMDWSKPGRLRREVIYRSRSLTGEWEKKVLIEKEFDGYGGIGQGCMLEGPDGKWRALIFQDRGAIGRVPCLMDVRWENDWPVIDEIPNDTSVPYADISGITGSDDFCSASLSLYWQFNHAPADGWWTLSERPGWLRLKALAAPSLPYARNTLTQRMVAPECSGAIRIDVSKMKDGDRAGIAAFSPNSAVLAVEMENGKKRIAMREENYIFDNTPGPKKHSISRIETSAAATAPLKGNFVWLRVRANFRHGENWAECDWSENGEKWHRIGGRVKLVFDYTRFFMGAKFAVFNYATRGPGGIVDVDRFIFDCKEHECSK